MKAIILQDIIVESNGINVIKSGTTILIDEGLKEIGLSLKSKIMNLVGDKSTAIIDKSIKQYTQSLSPEEKKDFQDQISIHHFGRTNDDNNYQTVIKGPVKYLGGLKQAIPEKLEVTFQPSYDYDIDDIVELERQGRPVEDTIKEFGKLYINRITEEDYNRAVQKAQELMKSKESEKPAEQPATEIIPKPVSKPIPRPVQLRNKPINANKDLMPA